MDIKIGDEIYVKHFGKKLKVEKVFVIGNDWEEYVCQISHQGTTYVMKGSKIQIEHIKPENKKSVENFEQNLMQISELFQEYHFARASSLTNPHVAKPLSLNLIVDLPKDQKARASFSYLNVQIIFEHGGVDLSKFQPITLEQTYNLMRQSANGLFLLHNNGIAHLDIKPANMVYDVKKDLLKIINLGSAFGSSNRKRLADPTVKLEDYVRSFTPEFAPPEVLLMTKGPAKNVNMELSLPAIDLYCWAMSFFSILTKRTYTDLKNYLDKYRTGLEADYKGFVEVVENCFDSIKPKNPKEAELMAVVSNLLTRALQYKPKERPIIENAIYQMKMFERKKRYTLDYSKIELAYNKELSKLLIPNDESKSWTPGEIKDLSVKLSCEHEVNKDHMIKYGLYLFLYKKPYQFSYQCEICGMVKKLKSLPLFCGCVWTKFGEKIKFNSDLTKGDYGKCNKGHPLTSIDLGLVNDFISVKFTSLMISDYPEGNEKLLGLFKWNIREESAEDIAWILRYTKALTKLNLRWKYIGVKGGKAIGEALRSNTTLTELNLWGNGIELEVIEAIGEVLKINTTLQILDLSYNEIEGEGAKLIANALKTNRALIRLDIENNNIGISGAKAIGEMLENNTTLTQLNINKNNIGVRGTKAISEALKKNKTLSILKIQCNTIGDEGVKAIIELLNVNTTLRELDLRGNNMEAEGEKLLEKAKEKYKHIEFY